MAQFGQSARLGAVRSQVRILLPRFFRTLFYKTRGSDWLVHSPCNLTPLSIICKRVMGIEPTYSAWKADVLPLNYTRRLSFQEMPSSGIEPETRGFSVLCSTN